MDLHSSNWSEEANYDTVKLLACEFIKSLSRGHSAAQNSHRPTGYSVTPVLVRAGLVLLYGTLAFFCPMRNTGTVLPGGECTSDFKCQAVIKVLERWFILETMEFQMWCGLGGNIVLNYLQKWLNSSLNSDISRDEVDCIITNSGCEIDAFNVKRGNDV